MYLLSHPQPVGDFVSIKVCLMETPTAWGCKSTASMLACCHDDNDLVSLAGLKLSLCKGGCTPCKQGQAGIWKQPVPGASACAPSLPRTVQDHWILVPWCQLLSGKWWKGIFCISSFKVSIADLLCPQTLVFAAETVSYWVVLHQWRSQQKIQKKIE